jgi:hypothetical protein
MHPSTPDVGLKALHARPATGRPRSFAPGQEHQVFRWRRSAPVWLGFRLVDAVRGSRPDRAEIRHQRDPAAIEASQRERFSAIASQEPRVVRSISGMSRGLCRYRARDDLGQERSGRQWSSVLVGGNRSVRPPR